MTARDRLASARQSSNLADRPDKLTDVSVLAAAGMVASRNGIGMALLRVRDTGDLREWPYCLAAVSRKVRSEKLKMSEREAHDLSEHILRGWVFPSCPSCDGRGYKKIAGAPILEQEPCGVCKGVGRLPIEYGLNAQKSSVARDTAAWLDRCAAQAMSDTARKVYGTTVC